MHIDLNDKNNVLSEEVPADLRKIVSAISDKKFKFDKYEGKKYQKYDKSPIYVEEYWDEEGDEVDYWHCYNICYKTYEINYCLNNDMLYIRKCKSSTVPEQCIK